MSCLPEIPDGSTIRAVLMLRTGLGWAVGVGFLIAGKIDAEQMAFADDKGAREAAIRLADRLDLQVYHG